VKHRIKIVFLGTPDFAVASLDRLVNEGFDIVGVVTAPDKPAGRGQQMHESAVKKYALAKGLKLLQPTKLKDESFLNELKALKADLQFVVAFRMLPVEVWDMPPLGTYNLHASLLPRYRGAAPINWAIINGEKETGVTTFKLKHEIDTGNVLFNDKVKIEDGMTAGELHDLLMMKGADLILRSAMEIENSFMNGTPLHYLVQDESSVSHAPKLFKETCKINWNKTAFEVTNLIHGLSPYPGAFTELKEKNGNPKIVKIYRVQCENSTHAHPAGTLRSDGKNYIKVYCRAGSIDILDLQLEGKKRMTTQEFLRGYKLTEEHTFLDQ
jgi:methionyl-tRNA formyltransferase